MNKFMLSVFALVFSGAVEAQNVGIGTNTPQEKLHVIGNTRVSTLAGAGNRLVGSDANGTLINIASGTNGQILTQTATGPVWQNAGGSDDWTILGNAGTTAGTNFLGTTDNVALRIRTNNTQQFEFTTAGRLRSFNNGNPIAPTYSWTTDPDIGMYRITTNVLGFSTSGAERVRIAANGNVGVNDVPNGNNNILTSRQWSTFGTSGYFYTSANSSWVNLEANSASTTQGVGVRGLGFTGVEGNVTSINGWAGYFDWDTYIDWMWYTGSTLVSDKRLKTQIQPIQDAGAIIDQLNPVTYQKKRGAFSLNRNVQTEGAIIPVTEISEYGFIAQEVQKVLPEIVKEKKMIVEGEEMDVMGVNYEMVIPILTQALKEQREEIELLKKEIEKLKVSK